MYQWMNQSIFRKKLFKQLAYVYESSIFYKAKFKEAGLSIGDIRSYEDFKKLLFTEKDELRESQRIQPPLPVKVECSADVLEEEKIGLKKELE